MPDSLKSLSKEEIRQALSQILTPEELKEINKQAIKEFLTEEKDKAKQKIGEWFLNTAVVLLITAFAWFTLNQFGWVKAPNP